MTDYTAKAHNATAEIAEGLLQITEIKLAATEVLKSITSVWFR